MQNGRINGWYVQTDGKIDMCIKPDGTTYVSVKSAAVVKQELRHLDDLRQQAEAATRRLQNALNDKHRLETAERLALPEPEWSDWDAVSAPRRQR